MAVMRLCVRCGITKPTDAFWNPERAAVNQKICYACILSPRHSAKARAQWREYDKRYRAKALITKLYKADAHLEYKRCIK